MVDKLNFSVSQSVDFTLQFSYLYCFIEKKL